MDEDKKYLYIWETGSRSIFVIASNIENAKKKVFESMCPEDEEEKETEGYIRYIFEVSVCSVMSVRQLNKYSMELPK